MFAQTDDGELSLRLRLYEMEERLDKSVFVRISHSELINLCGRLLYLGDGILEYRQTNGSVFCGLVTDAAADCISYRMDGTFCHGVSNLFRDLRCDFCYHLGCSVFLLEKQDQQVQLKDRKAVDGSFDASHQAGIHREVRS